MVFSGSRPSMIAASPNWRSRSRSSVRLPSNLANAAARFVDVTVLPVPPFGENTVTIRPRRVGALTGGFAGRLARLADGEDDVLGHLREEQDVRHVGVQRLLEQDRGLARGEQDDRRPRVLAERGDLVAPGAWSCASRAARPRGGRRSAMPADSATPTLVPTSSTSAWRSSASRSWSRPSQRARDEDPGLLADGCGGGIEDAHCSVLPGISWASCWPLRPSVEERSRRSRRSPGCRRHPAAAGAGASSFRRCHASRRRASAPARQSPRG